MQNHGKSGQSHEPEGGSFTMGVPPPMNLPGSSVRRQRWQRKPTQNPRRNHRWPLLVLVGSAVLHKVTQLPSKAVLVATTLAAVDLTTKEPSNTPQDYPKRTQAPLVKCSCPWASGKVRMLRRRPGDKLHDMDRKGNKRPEPSNYPNQWEVTKHSG